MSHKYPEINKSCAFLKKVSLVFCLFCTSVHLYSQTTQAEKEYRNKIEDVLSSEKTDSIKFQFLVDNLRTLSPVNSRLPIYYSKIGIELATVKSEKHWRGELYSILGSMYAVLSRKDSAEIITEKALSDYKETGNEAKVLETHYTLSQMYGANDSSDKSLEHSYAAIAICEKNGDKEGLAKSSLHIAGNLFNLDEPQRAIKFAEKALALYTESENKYAQFDTYMHLAAYHSGSDEKALLQIEKGQAILNDNPQLDRNAWIHFYCSRIVVLERMEDYESIERDLDLVDSISAADQNLSMKFYLAFKRAATAHKLEKYEEARDLFMQNITDSLVDNNPYLYYNYEYLSDNFKKLNLWDSAYHYHMILHEMEYQDKKQESSLNMEQIKAKYETEKKEAIIINQNKRLSQQRLIQWLTLGIALLLGLLLYQSIKNERIKRKANEKLKNLDIVKSRLYNNITHEFRTPLTVINGMAAQIEESPEEWLKDGLAMIQRNSNRLLELVNHMLDLSKLQSGTLNLNTQQDDLILYVSYIVQSMHSFARSKKVQIHFHSEVDELVMDFDSEKIQQILVNLLSNAIKFTLEEGDIYVLINQISKTGTTENREMLQIKVKDTGEGIHEDQIPYIFERFYQVDSSTTRKGEGSGIGLAIVKELVNMMNGEISVRSNIDKENKDRGTEFILLLPITNNSPMAIMSEVLPKSELTENTILRNESLIKIEANTEVDRNLDKPKVLLVEDNADVVTYIISCLQNTYEIIVGNNGQEGVEMAFENTPDLVITDVMMPIQDGYQVCERLKSDIRTSHIPIIMLTAKADLESKMDGLEKGADAYLAKPFHKKELLIRIKKLLELRKKIQAYYLSIASSAVPNLELEKLPTSKPSESQFVKQLKEIIDQNLDDTELTVEKVCKSMNMSQSHLHRKTTALTGISPNKLIRVIRLNKAKVLLKDQSKNISIVAYEIGFSDPSYFGRVFKKEFGVTPLEWQKSEVK